MSNHGPFFYRAAKFGPSESLDRVGISARGGSGMFPLALEDIKVRIPGLQLVCAPVTLAVNLYGKESPANLRIVYFPPHRVICRSVHGSPARLSPRESS